MKGGSIIKKTVVYSMLMLCFLLTPAVSVTAQNNGPVSYIQPSFSSYTYDYWGNPVQCPHPYTVEKIVTGVDLGIGDLKKPNDLFVDHSGLIYLAASGDLPLDNRIVVLDEMLNVRRIITGYTDHDGKIVPFAEPLGVFVTAGSEIYVADGISKKIIHMDEYADLIRIIDAPNHEDSAIINQNFVDRYRPSKLVVDGSGRIHVVAINVNEGIVEFDPDGEFEGFLAAGKVNANPVEVIWKKISTKDQLDRMADFVPIEYNNISLDDEDFIMATSAAIKESIVLSEIRSGSGTEQGALVRRLNMLGKDILRRRGFGPPVGEYDIFDTINNIDAAYQGISRIMDVSCGRNGTYSILDNNRSRIFTYDSEGFLLYAFGGPDVTAQGFRTPVSIAEYDDHLYVLDSNTRALTMFKRTEFAAMIAQAIDQQEAGDHFAAAQSWRKVLDMNANYDLAYTGLGKSAYRSGDYKEAMRSFELGSNREWYSRAYKEYRKAIIARWFATFVYISVAIAVLLILAVKLIKRHRINKKGEKES